MDSIFDYFLLMAIILMIIMIMIIIIIIMIIMIIMIIIIIIIIITMTIGASFWSTRLTWRCFFCAMTTMFTLYMIKTANSLFGHSDNAAMFSFGEFFSLEGETSNYSVWYVFL